MRLIRREKPVQVARLPEADDPEALRHKIEAAGTEATQADADAERLDAQADELLLRGDERDLDEYRQRKQQAADARARAAFARARAKRQAEALPMVRWRHYAPIARAGFEEAAAIGRQYVDAIRRAGELAAAYAKILDDLRSQIGGALDSQIHPLVFGGMVHSRYTEPWCTETAPRILDAVARAELPRPPAAPDPAAPQLPGGVFPRRTGVVLFPWHIANPAPGGLHGAGAAKVLPPTLQHQGDTPTPPTATPRPADDTAPLLPGEVRVRVLRTGFSPADDRPHCHIGQVVRMAAEPAALAESRAAVEIIEQGPPLLDAAE